MEAYFNLGSVVIVIWIDGCFALFAAEDVGGVPEEVIEGGPVLVPPNRKRVRQRNLEAIAIIRPTGAADFSSSTLKNIRIQAKW